ncbi:MAG: TldD/PmbA family protein [Deltaproteobacteria bacterium]|nr:TldD/PmbA family protein [Deltaproteobacteria bacterium]
MSDQPRVDADLAALAEDTLKLAQARGAGEVAVGVGQSRFTEIKRRDGAIEVLRASTSRGLSLTLYLDGRFSSNGTSYLEPAALSRFVDEALAMTRRLQPDPHRGLADPSLYGPTPGAEIDTWDPRGDVLPMERRHELLEEAELAAREHLMDGPVVVSVSVSQTSQASRSLQLHSNGFAGEHAQTGHYLGVGVTVRDEGARRPQDHDFAGGCHFDILPAAATIGHEAARRAAFQVGARKLKSGSMTLLVESRAASRLVGTLLGAATGQALDQRRSFLQEHEGEAVGSPLLDLFDDPLLPRGVGSRTFDGDGLVARRLSLFSRGVFENPLIGVYYGRKLERSPTTASTSNLVLTPGEASLDELVKEIDHGVLVTSFIGGNSSMATGDFSFGIVGEAIAGGERVHPVSEMNVSGNHLELWKRLVAVGNDPYAYGSRVLPSLRFDDVTLSGS